MELRSLKCRLTTPPDSTSSPKILHNSTFCAVGLIGLSLMGSMSSAFSQPYGYRDRDDGYRNRDQGYRDRDYGRRHRQSGFDEREYLRCNRDVLRAVRRGETTALQHYQQFGRYER